MTHFLSMIFDWGHDFVSICGRLQVERQAYYDARPEALVNQLDVAIVYLFCVECLVRVATEGSSPWRYFTGEKWFPRLTFLQLNPPGEDPPGFFQRALISYSKSVSKMNLGRDRVNIFVRKSHLLLTALFRSVFFKFPFINSCVALRCARTLSKLYVYVIVCRNGKCGRNGIALTFVFRSCR